MFSGIVEELGTVRGNHPRGDGCRLEVGARKVLNGSHVGASLAVDGVCLTVVDRGEGSLAFDVGPETTRVTTLGGLEPGDPVNLERPVRIGEPLGGHMVSGHVDGVGRITSMMPEGDALWIDIELPSNDLERYLIPKGSVAVDGVSLTVAALTEGGFRVMIIPHTAQVTTLGRKGIGRRVNLEMDLVGKYLFRFHTMDARRSGTGITREFLARAGFIPTEESG